MSQEDAIQFVALAKTDEALRPTLLRYSLSRNFAIIADAAAERGLTFTREEFIEAQRGPQPTGDAPAESANQWLSVAPAESDKSAAPPDETPPSESVYTPQPFDPNAVEFFLNGGNRDFVMGQWPHPVLRYKGRTLLENLALAIIFAAAAVYCFIDYYGSYAKYAELRDEGVVVMGEVVGGRAVTERTNTSSQTNYYVTFSYTYDDSEYERESKISAATYNNLQVGDEVRVRVSTQHPDLATLDTDNRQDAMMGFLAAGAGIIAALLAIRAFYFHLHERRFWGKGQVLAGVAADSDYRYVVYSRYNRKLHARIVVRFRSPQGRWITKTILSHYGNLVHRLPRNQKAAIYYVDDQHWWLL